MADLAPRCVDRTERNPPDQQTCPEYHALTWVPDTSPKLVSGDEFTSAVTLGMSFMLIPWLMGRAYRAAAWFFGSNATP